MTSVSTYGLNLTLANSLLNQQNVLGQLSQETATGKKYQNFTDYNPTDAHTVFDSQSIINQRQSYLSSMQTVQTRLSIYDTTMTDMESVAQQASSLASQNPNYDAKTVDTISAEASNYLKQLTDDLNQQVSGRYIYAGTRYTTKPVNDLTTLTDTPPTTTVSSPTLPDYDTDYGNVSSFSVNSTPTGTANFNISNVSIPWSQISAGNVTSITIGGVSTPVTITGLTTPATTTAQQAANLATTLNQIQALPGVTGLTSMTASSNGNVVTTNFNNTTPQSITPDSGGVVGETTWATGSLYDGTVTKDGVTSTPSYTTDSVLIDSGYTLNYGASSNDPSIQNLINGLRNIVAACAAGKAGNTAAYTTGMAQATAIETSALSGIQVLHTQVANNQNILTSVTSTQNADITALQNELSGIQTADLTTLGAEISSLQTQLQASYSATSSLEKLSLVKYL